jgi:hypothetical protein
MSRLLNWRSQSRPHLLADRFLQKRYEAGRVESQRKWEAWYGRLLEAIANGKTFNEPPPTLEKKQ